MRRAGIPAAGIDAIRRAYQLIHRTEKTLPSALMQLEADLGDVDVVVEMVGGSDGPALALARTTIEAGKALVTGPITDSVAFSLAGGINKRMWWV